jgi:ferredoxin-NADP reductase
MERKRDAGVLRNLEVELGRAASMARSEKAPHAARVSVKRKKTRANLQGIFIGWLHAKKRKGRKIPNEKVKGKSRDSAWIETVFALKFGWR